MTLPFHDARTAYEYVGTLKPKTMKTKTAPTQQLWDAIAVNIETNKVCLFGERKTFRNAEAISKMAIMRRGCDVEFYVEVHTGTYKEGDCYDPARARTQPEAKRGERLSPDQEQRIIERETM